MTITQLQTTKIARSRTFSTRTDTFSTCSPNISQIAEANTTAAQEGIDAKLTRLLMERKGECLTRAEISKHTGISIGRIRRCEENALRKLLIKLKGNE